MEKSDAQKQTMIDKGKEMLAEAKVRDVVYWKSTTKALFCQIIEYYDICNLSFLGVGWVDSRVNDKDSHLRDITTGAGFQSQGWSDGKGATERRIETWLE